MVASEGKANNGACVGGGGERFGLSAKVPMLFNRRDREWMVEPSPFLNPELLLKCFLDQPRVRASHRFRLNPPIF